MINKQQRGEKKLYKTRYFHQLSCCYCGEPVAEKMTLSGWKSWEIHKDNCSRPRVKLNINPIKIL